MPLGVPGHLEQCAFDADGTADADRAQLERLFLSPA
jgi:hypothetical protein